MPSRRRVPRLLTMTTLSTARAHPDTAERLLTPAFIRLTLLTSHTSLRPASPSTPCALGDRAGGFGQVWSWARFLRGFDSCPCRSCSAEPDGRGHQLQLPWPLPRAGVRATAWRAADQNSWLQRGLVRRRSAIADRGRDRCRNPKPSTSPCRWRDAQHPSVFLRDLCDRWTRRTRCRLGHRQRIS
jgi:hypothetical protein